MANPKPDSAAGTRGALAAKEAGWPNGKPGNRRTGLVKTAKTGRSGHRGQLPAIKDAHVQSRRARVAQIDLAGHRPAIMLETINQWLEAIATEAGVHPSDYRISMTTLNNDRKANLEESLRECGETAELARQYHVERLRGLWVRVFRDWENADSGKRNSTLDRLLKIDELLGKYDGSAALAARGGADQSASSLRIELVGVDPADI
jgi:hypothetical protein